MKTLHVPIIIEIDKDGVFILSCPQFKGCHTYGKTIDETLSRIKEVIELCMEEFGAEHINTFVGFREVEIIQGTQCYKGPKNFKTKSNPAENFFISIKNGFEFFSFRSGVTAI